MLTAISIHDDLLLAVQDRIQRLVASDRLQAIAERSVVARLVPNLDDFGSPGSGKNYAFPAICVSTVGSETMLATAGSNERDDIGYPVLILIAATKEDAETNRVRYLAWRQYLADEFRHKRLRAGTVEFHDSVVEPGPIVDWNRFIRDGIAVGNLTVRFFVRQKRGPR